MMKIIDFAALKHLKIIDTVLVKAELNRDKTNIYPIEEKIRTKMYPFWKHL